MSEMATYGVKAHRLTKSHFLHHYDVRFRVVGPRASGEWREEQWGARSKQDAERSVREWWQKQLPNHEVEAHAKRVCA